jgi:hypothetical protein
MDEAVAHAYGWDDLDLEHGFHETKQGLRYTMSKAAMREVLDRLLLLNHERHKQEVKAGVFGAKGAKGKGAKAKKVKSVVSDGKVGGVWWWVGAGIAVLITDQNWLNKLRSYNFFPWKEVLNLLPR